MKALDDELEKALDLLQMKERVYVMSTMDKRVLLGEHVLIDQNATEPLPKEYLEIVINSARKHGMVADVTYDQIRRFFRQFFKELADIRDVN